MFEKISPKTCKAFCLFTISNELKQFLINRFSLFRAPFKIYLHLGLRAPTCLSPLATPLEASTCYSFLLLKTKAFWSEHRLIPTILSFVGGDSAGARAFKVGEPNLKVGGQIFLFILALKKHDMHNAITSINNSLIQSKIILIGVTISELLFSEHFL